MASPSDSFPDPLFSVNDRVVIVTGGVGLLGRQFARALWERGARIAIFDAAADLERVRSCFGELWGHPRLWTAKVDVTDRAALEKGVDALMAEWGVPHGLINNAAIDSPPDTSASENGPFEDYPAASWDRVMAVNVRGVVHACQVIGGRMAKAGRGSIVNISSIYGMVSPDQRLYAYRRDMGEVFFKPASYAASKSSLLNLTRYLATYWAESGVRVNALSFGGVYNRQDERFVRNYAGRVPLGRMAREDEYNGAVVFLMSDASSYMTGANVVVDGGFTAW